MATMTATFIKPSTEPSSKGLYHHPTLTASKSSSLAYPSSGGSSSSSSNSRFPYLAYKSPEALYGDNSSKTAAAEAFLALHHHHQSATNLILRSSSLYDNSNYARTSAGGSVSPFSSKSSHSFAHPDFDASMLLAQQQQKQSPIKSTVIPIPSSNSSSNSSNASNQLPRVEVAKVSTTAKPKGSFSSASSSSSSEDGENYYRRQNNRSSSLVDRLTSEEHQALSRLLYKHFASNSSSATRVSSSNSTGTGNAAKSSLNESAVPADYDEEDPRTWPSNWLAQVPTMILSPEVYLASKPLLNAYQRQLIRRLSAKYEPLVHYLQQLVALRNSGGGIGSSEEVVRKLGGGGSGGDSFVGANILQSSSPRGSSSAKKQQQQQQPLLVKSSSHASALSQQQQQQNAANNSGPSQHYHHQQMNNSFDLGGFCHSKEGTVADSNSSSRRSIINGTVDVLRSSPSLDSSALSSASSSNSSSMSSSRSNSSLSTSSSSSPPPPAQAPQKAPVVQAAEVGAIRENRLARLSQQMANKWSNKMKIYLRKN